MIVKITNEQGYYDALFGIGLSYGITSDKNINDLSNEDWIKLHGVAKKLYSKQGGHNKFLESMQVWIDITAPRYWWAEADTYRHISKQSASTIHTLTKKKLTQFDFAMAIPVTYLHYLNNIIEQKNLKRAKALLPEGFLQRRMVKADYKSLQNMIHQRKNHILEEWAIFIASILSQINHPEFLEV